MQDLKRRLRHTGVYVAAGEIWDVVRRYRRDAPLRRVISLKPRGAVVGDILVSYRIDPFLVAPEEVSTAHPIHWISLQMAQTFLELGYAVDVVNDKNSSFIPRKNYVACVAGRWNLERLRAVLGDRCLYIMHADTAHILYHNSAECRRLLELQQRRGVVLSPRRLETPTLAIEHADCAVIHGNEFTLGTYKYAKKPLYAVPTPALALYPLPEHKDLDGCRRRFLWLASRAMVHKGLDLVLDAFAELPDYHLVVCGPVHREADFESAYRKELHESPNVTTVGWIDMSSRRFAEIASNSLALLYPSCSEGQAGAVTTCLQAGLIPIVSYQSGVDVHDFGLTLTHCTVTEIRDAVRHLSNLPTHRLAEMTRKAWQCARASFTREAFAARYRDVVVQILASHRQSSAGTVDAQRTRDGS
jgi:glycosyltransferase involved in cell wall biosynthesis